MESILASIFKTIVPPPGGDPDKAIYAVVTIPSYENCFIGKDSESHACLLVATADRQRQRPAPIRLESLDAQFQLRCQLKKAQEPDREDTFTVVRCRSVDQETIYYFLSVCETVLRAVGNNPTQRAVASAVNRLAALFQKLQNAPRRPVNGLFGELFLISRSGNPIRALAAWRIDDSARFDFSDGDIRIDVKATAGRVRAHTFSYEQCNPPSGTIAVAASLFVEHSPGGITLRSLIEQIERKTSANVDLLFKLYNVITATLGKTLNEALALKFDEKLADSSLRFFSLHDVPAVRGPLACGISDVHFRSDLSGLQTLPVQTLIDWDPAFWDLLPREIE